ncbi:unnamed protein product [Meganyctiphanes norvegica]|uniref:E2 ubiquitin-conjugating enzyme n=1 Tax=Meganyctiphanes norvegica TaxID=48144 RepID=A0AAV2RVL6_MEGNR
MASKRIHKELSDLGKNPEIFFSANTIADDIHQWQIFLPGPKGSAFEDGVFFLTCHFPTDYPFKRPKLAFQTEIYHPQVNSNGAINLPILWSQWDGGTIFNVMKKLVEIMKNPKPDDPLRPDIAKELKENPEQWFKTAQEWTRKHAGSG